MKYYNYESVTKELYTFENLTELLKLNEGRKVRLYTENHEGKYSHNFMSVDNFYKLKVSEDNENLVINDIVINKNDIYDVKSGTHFGNWLLIKVDDADNFHTVGIVIHEQNNKGENDSFRTTDYWDKVVEDYNS